MGLKVFSHLAGSGPIVRKFNLFIQLPISSDSVNLHFLISLFIQRIIVSTYLNRSLSLGGVHKLRWQDEVLRYVVLEKSTVYRYSSRGIPSQMVNNGQNVVNVVCDALLEETLYSTSRFMALAFLDLKIMKKTFS